MFKSQELWEIVETGYVEPEQPPTESSQTLRDNRKKDAKALFFIQSALDDDIFPRISSAKTAKEAWEIIKHEHFGDKKVISVKLQYLRSSFDNLSHKEKEPVQSYLSRVSGHVVAAIEESLDFSTYTFDELMCSLITHEEKILCYDDKVEEKAFQVKGESFKLLF